MDVNNPLKMVLIGIDPYPYFNMFKYAAWKSLLWSTSCCCIDNGQQFAESHAGHVQTATSFVCFLSSDVGDQET